MGVGDFTYAAQFEFNRMPMVIYRAIPSTRTIAGRDWLAGAADNPPPQPATAFTGRATRAGHPGLALHQQDL